MMLKAYYCKIRDILKRQMWLAALWFAVLFFALPVHAALRIQDMRNWPTDLIDTVAFNDRITSGLLEIFGLQSFVLVWILMPMALISALVFGSYMHKQKQVDFYHSQPVRRHTLLLQHGAAGLLAVLLPYLANLLLTLIVAVVMGAAGGIPWGGLFGGIAVHTLFCIAIFTTVMLAVVISGNGAVALLTGIFLLGVLPAMLGLGLIMASEYYPTFYSQLYDWEIIIRWLSPAAAYACVPISGLPHTIFPIIIYDALIIGLTLRLYNKRGSETAGQAIAFKAAKPILKYLVATLAATCFAMVFRSISDYNNGSFWWYFGAVTGAFLATQITEIVYAFDFRAIRRHLVGWAVFVVAYLAIFTGIMADITGFNTRVPEASNVVKAEVYLTGVNSHYYNYWGYNYGYNNVYQDEQAFVQRTEKDILAQGTVESEAGIAAAVNIARQLVTPGINVSDEQRALWQQEGKDYLLGYIGADRSWEGIPVHANNTSLRVVFTLANGSTIARDYTNTSIPIQFIPDDIRAISEDETFRKAQLEQLEYLPQQYLPEQLEIFETFYDISALPTGIGERMQLLEALKADLSSLTVDEQLQSMPIGAVHLRLYAGEVHADEMSVERNSRPYRGQRWPIYASFDNTLALLEEWGYGPELWQPNLEAVRQVILIENYAYRGGDAKYNEMMHSGVTNTYANYATSEQSAKYGESTPITDPAEIERLIRDSYPAEAPELNCFIDIDNRMEIEVMYEGMGGQTFFTRRVFSY